MREENQIQIFNNDEFGEIRTLIVNNKPYFVGKDIAEKLGYSNASKAVLMHCKNGIKEMIAHSQNGNVVKTQTTLIPEGDVFRLIIKSKLPKAQEFESWVMDEVLPQIRKTGGYIPIEENITEKEILARAFLITKKTIQIKDEQIKRLLPKAESFDAFMNTENLMDFNVVAKNLGIGRNSMLEILRENRILIDGRYEDYNGNIKYKESHNTPYQRFSKYFTVKFIIDNKNKRHTTTYVTSEGQEYIRKKLISLGYINNVA